MRFSLKIIVGFVLIILVGGIYWFTKPSVSSAMNIPQAVPVVSAPVETQEIIVTIQAFGSLYAPYDTVIANEVSGVIEAISFTPGQVAEENDLLLTLNSDALSTQLAQAQAELKISDLDYRRSQNLFERNAVAQQDLETAEAGFEARQAARDAAQVEVDKTQIRAPFTGRLGAQNVSVGDYVTAGTPLVNLVNKRVLKARFAVPEIYLNQLQLGQQVTLTTQAYPGETFVRHVN